MLVTETLPHRCDPAWADAACAVSAVGTVVCGEPLLDAGQAATFTLAVTVDVALSRAPARNRRPSPAPWSPIPTRRTTRYTPT